MMMIAIAPLYMNCLSEHYMINPQLVLLFAFLVWGERAGEGPALSVFEKSRTKWLQRAA